MAKNKEVKVTYKVINAEFNKGIREIGSQITSLNKEFRLQTEQMKLTGSETQKLESQLGKLTSEYELAKQKSAIVAQGLEQVKKATGESSKETQLWTNKLTDAKTREEYLKNAIEQTKKSLTNATSETTKHKQALDSLEKEQEQLAAASEKVTAKYALEKAKLGENASESKQLKVRKQELAEQMKVTAQQVDNLEKQLREAKAVYGDNATEVNKLEKELLEAKKAYIEYSAELDKASDKILKFSEGSRKIGENLTDAGKKLTMGVTTPLVGVGATATKAFTGFDDAMRRVAATAGMTADETDKNYTAMRNQAKELGASTRFSASEVADGMNYMAMAGWDASKTMKAIPDVLDLAVASGESLGTTSDIVTDAMTAFGLGAERTGEFTDILAATSSSANTNVSLLGETFKYAAPVAGALGYTAQDTAAAIGLMANAGIKGSQAGTSLKTGLVNLAKPTDQMKTAMDKYGISLTDSEGNMLSLREVMVTLRDKMGNLSEAEQASAGAAIFGKEAMAGWLSVINASDSDFDRLITNIDNSEGSTKTMVDTVNGGAGGAFANLKSATEGAAIAIGEALAPSIKKVTKWLTDLASRFASLPKETQSIIATVGAIVAAAGPVLIIIGKIVTAIGTIAGMFATGGILSGVIPWVGGVITTIGAVPLAIAAVLAGVVYLVFKHWDKIKTGLNAGIDWIKNLFKNLGAWFVEIWTKTSSSVSQFWDKTKSAFTSGWEAVKAATIDLVGKVVDWVKEKWKSLIEFASIFMETLGNVFKLAWLVIKEIFNIAWLAIETPIRLAWEIFWAFTQDFWRGVGDFFSKTWQAVSDFAVNTWQSLITNLSNFWETCKQTAQRIFQPIGDFISKIWQQASQVTTSIWQTISSYIDGKIKQVQSVLNAVLSAIGQFISNQWENIKSATLTAWQAVYGYVSDKINQAKTTLQNITSALLTVISSVWQNVKNATSDAWSWVVSHISNAINDVRDYVSSGFNAAKDMAINAFNNIKDGIANIISRVVETVSSGVERLKNMFNFNWELPHIKLPHFSIDGEFSLNPPSIPHIGVEWYAKGGIMTRPTVFGMNGSNMMVGGEAGPEAVLPLTSKVLGMIGAGAAQAFGVSHTQNDYGGNTVNVYATVRSEPDMDRLVDKIDEALGYRDIDDRRGRGG